MTAYIAELTAIDKTTLPADGGKRFNRLIFARSPYLLQHAENPVKWYEWGDAAFAKARTENLPILLSIGYATCHWCHVMAHESFEDGEVAALLNRHFVCIKVDREERPDIDDFYMAVAQTLTGSGGWPLNIFMTPEKRPFMAVTYLPKRGRDGMSGLMELLANIATLWQQRPDMIDKNCRGIMEALDNSRKGRADGSTPDVTATSEKALQTLKRIYDPLNGGFGTAPKFPMPIYLRWLIGQRQQLPHPHPNLPLEGEGILKPRLKRERTFELEIALHTLRKMRGGGIWDQLGGGMHRYSVDQFWLAPHFEKMLYDQAMLAQVATEAFRATGESFLRAMAENIFTFAARELQTAEGAFCSALDADSEGIEGKFYLWDKREIDACLGSDSDQFCRYHAVTDEGNFEGETILTTPVDLDEYCRLHRLHSDETYKQLERCRATLLKRREARIRPLRDDKIITSWNGLMISALATAAAIFNKPEYADSAARAATFINTRLRRNDGRVLRSYLDGASDVPGFLEDYAFLAGGMLDLFEATLDQNWLTEAQVLARDILKLFRDPDSGEFTLIGHDAEQMPARMSSDHDGVTPSAFSRTAHLLYRLAWIDDRPEFLTAARAALAAIGDGIQHNPLGHLGALQMLSLLEATPTVATFSGDARSSDASTLNRALHGYAISNLIVNCDNRPAPLSLSICFPGTCLPAVSTVQELERIMQLQGIALIGSNCNLPAPHAL
ncbi:MAG: thioredoxin domain-containing protein [Desulfuromonadaceae bacterium]|nr:thioredoxin domain-containing protein [Desulfuromonadaceae bacterium]